MKKSMFLVALLVIPAVAFAGTATMSLKLSGGATAITVAPNTPVALTAVWSLDDYAGAPNGIANVDAVLHASANNVFKFGTTARVWGAPFSSGKFDAATPAALNNLALNPDSANLGALALNPAFDDPMAVGNYTTLNAPLPWTLNTINLIVNAAPGVYTLTIPGAFAGTSDDLGAPVALDTALNNGITVTVTPEPATMLLLAAAVPFLRRRSA